MAASLCGGQLHCALRHRIPHQTTSSQITLAASDALPGNSELHASSTSLGAGLQNGADHTS